MIARILLAAAMALPFCLPAAAETQMYPGDVKMVMTRTIEDVVRPGYAAFHASTSALAASTEKLCSAPASEALDTARATFRNTVLAWAEIEHVRFGPVMDQNRLERILFWPDRKGTGLKQVQAALATRDETATNLESLQQKSVAMQGLNALEFVLFGTGSADLATEAVYRCGYARTIAANLVRIADELETAWNDPAGPSSFWTADQQANDVGQSLSELVGTMVHGLELVRDTRLRPFIDLEGTRDRPKSALFWRSAMTLPMMRADIDGLTRFFEESAMELLLPADQASIASSIKFELRELRELIPAGDRPVDEVLADAATRGRLVLLDTVFDSLIDRLDKQYAGATGLSAGFSFADGD